MNSKTVNDLIDSLESLQANIQQYHQGRKSAYKDIAVQLYKLLFNEQGSDNKSILRRLFSQSALHPIRSRMPNHLLNDPSLILRSPARISFDGKGDFKLEELFDEGSAPIPIEEWLDQKLFNQDITIRELIKSVRHKEAAHSDPNYNSTLIFAKNFRIISTESQGPYIVSVGEYILKSLAQICKHYNIILPK